MRKLLAAGYPVPKVFLLETEDSPVNRPFVIMEYIPGETMWNLLNTEVDPVRGVPTRARASARPTTKARSSAAGGSGTVRHVSRDHGSMAGAWPARSGAARVALGGVAPVPWRARKAEAALLDSPLTASAIARTAEAALSSAEPLSRNGYKLDLIRGAVAGALRSLQEPKQP